MSVTCPDGKRAISGGDTVLMINFNLVLVMSSVSGSTFSATYRGGGQVALTAVCVTP